VENRNTVKLIPRQPARPVRTDDNLGRGMDFALVTFVFLGAGWALDRWIGTRPLFMIVFVVVSLVGQFARMWFDYEKKMAQHEADRMQNRLAPTPGSDS
jgi:F0F1-type ATP synthase assembly protein I